MNYKHYNIKLLSKVFFSIVASNLKRHLNNKIICSRENGENEHCSLLFTHLKFKRVMQIFFIFYYIVNIYAQTFCDVFKYWANLL